MAVPTVVIQMDADFSHDPAVLPRCSPRSSKAGGPVIGSRYVTGAARSTGASRRVISRVGSMFARTLLRLGRTISPVVQGLARETLAASPSTASMRAARVPDRDDVPGQPRRSARPRGPDRVPRPADRAERRCRAGSSSRRCSSSSASGGRSCAAASVAGRPASDRGNERAGTAAGAIRPTARPISGMRVVLDARPLQEPDRAPVNCRVPGRSARRLRRRTAPRRVVRLLPAVRPRRPHHGLRPWRSSAAGCYRPRDCCARRR